MITVPNTWFLKTDFTEVCFTHILTKSDKLIHPSNPCHHTLDSEHSHHPKKPCLPFEGPFIFSKFYHTHIRPLSHPLLDKLTATKGSCSSFSSLLGGKPPACLATSSHSTESYVPYLSNLNYENPHYEEMPV